MCLLDRVNKDIFDLWVEIYYEVCSPLYGIIHTRVKEFGVPKHHKGSVKYGDKRAFENIYKEKLK